MSIDAGSSRWHPETIPGRRVFLRRHRPEQFPAVLRWYRDPEVARLTRFQIGPVSEEEVRHYFGSRLLAPDAFVYAVHLSADERLIGTTTLSSLDPENGSVLFHITIGEHDCWGRGFGTEATELLVGHAFEVLGLHRVGLSVFEFNTRAIRSYEKVGFQIEGHAREAVWRDGAYWDEIHMGILESDWRRLHGRGRASVRGISALTDREPTPTDGAPEMEEPAEASGRSGSRLRHGNR